MYGKILQIYRKCMEKYGKNIGKNMKTYRKCIERQEQLCNKDNKFF